LREGGLQEASRHLVTASSSPKLKLSSSAPLNPAVWEMKPGSGAPEALPRGATTGGSSNRNHANLGLHALEEGRPRVVQPAHTELIALWFRELDEQRPGDCKLCLSFFFLLVPAAAETRAYDVLWTKSRRPISMRDSGAATGDGFCETWSEPWPGPGPGLAARVISFAGRRASGPASQQAPALPGALSTAKLVEPCARYFSPRCRFPGCASNLRPSSAALGHTPAFGSLLSDLSCSFPVQAICVSINSFERKNPSLVWGPKEGVAW
jgi:hypothetical protein